MKPTAVDVTTGVTRLPHRSAGVSSAWSRTTWAIGWQQLLAAIVADTLAGRPVAEVAADFHQAVAALLVDLAAQLRTAGLATGRLGLSGGVFQNALLVELADAGLQANGHDLLLHHQVPANDGGLALGQAVLGRERTRSA